jgi:hypothetical protein
MLPLMALILVALVAVVGLAVDVGLIYAARAELVRAVDAAALAAVADLPDTNLAASSAEDYVAANEPTAQVEAVSFPQLGQVRVEASKRVKLFFLPIIPGISAKLEEARFFRVHAHAVAGAGISVPMDVVLVMDDTGTMRSGCNSGQTNSGCPIKGARDGANALLDILGVSDTNPTVRVGVVPFRGCFSNSSNRYNPVSGESAERGCVIPAEILNLTNDRTALQNVIASLRADGGYPGTNICLGLWEGNQRLFGVNSRPNARKVIVILTDGDNRYSDGSQSSSRGNNPNPGGAAAPPVYVPNQWPNAGSTPLHACRVTGPAQNSSNYGPDYDSRINDLDTRTLAQATLMKAAGVEIFVIGYGVVGAPSNDLCLPNQVGTGGNRQNGTTDSQDRNLAKCVASSEAGTNDHYFEAPTPEEIPDMFTQVATVVATRLIE